MTELIFDGKALRPIPDFPGYFVSACGDVFSTRRRSIKPRKIYVDSRGYSQFTAYRHGKPKCVRVNRAVALAWIGPAPEGTECCHRNGVRSDNYFKNLRWDTHANNEADKALHGTKPMGESHPLAKLTAHDVVRIREAKRNGGRFWGAAQFAKELGIQARTVMSIAQGRGWPDADPGMLRKLVWED